MPHLPHASTRRHVYKLSSHVSGEWQVTRVSYSQSVPVHTPPEYLPVPCSTPGRGMQTSCRTRLCLQNCNRQSTLCCRFQHWCVVTWDMAAVSVGRMRCVISCQSSHQPIRRLIYPDLGNQWEDILWSHYPRKWPVNIGPGPSRSTQTWNLAIKHPQNTRLEQFTFLW